MTPIFANGKETLSCMNSTFPELYSYMDMLSHYWAAGSTFLGMPYTMMCRGYTLLHNSSIVPVGNPRWFRLVRD
jgi:hypothetical protein